MAEIDENRNISNATRYVHAAEDLQQRPSVTYPLAPPIVQTTVYGYHDTAEIDRVHDEQEPGYIYLRYGLPNAIQLEEALSQIESAEAGIATTSATSAILATFLTLLQSDDRVIVGHNTYGGTRGLLNRILARFNVSTDYVDLTNLSEVARGLDARPQPKLLWADTLSNPTLITNDIPELARLAGARGVPLVVDNTFATPFHFNPLAHGADLVIHSGTKFIGGHNDVSSGVVLGSRALVEPIRRIAMLTGAVGGPFDSWLSVRGLRTMEVRLERSSANALAIASALEHHPRVRRVHYPGLESDPHHETACTMFKNGYGSMVSVDFGDDATLRAVLDRLEIIQIAETLGGLMTTVVAPRISYYRDLSPDGLAQLGISPGLARFSVGIETASDLVNDLQHALT